MPDTQTLLESIVEGAAERTPLAGATVERITVGDRLLLVELAGSEAAGVTHRPAGGLDVDPAGRPALALAEWAVDPGDGEDRLRRAVGVATVNALSTPLIEWRTGDPFEALPPDVDTIATVGLFGPAFRKFGAVEVRVIEREPADPPETPEGVTVSTYGPSEGETAMAGADVVFVTGSSLLYGGIDGYLTAARDVADVILVGATASFAPAPAFEAGVTMLAGVRVTDAESVRRRIQAGECATDIHDHGLEKVFVTAERAASQLELG